MLRPCRRPGLGFGARLGLALGLTLVLVSSVGYWEVADILESRVIDQEAVYQRV
ncbi:MAG: hypothetical protein QOF33_4895 [Thermomicrobiales bacterium]|nr:hypothetical protein [Thermomicrobiales bacterium]